MGEAVAPALAEQYVNEHSYAYGVRNLWELYNISSWHATCISQIGYLLTIVYPSHQVVMGQYLISACTGVYFQILQYMCVVYGYKLSNI